MTPDLQQYARLLLSREPTRSLPLRILRERLRLATGQQRSGTLGLEQALANDPSFRVLAPVPLTRDLAPGYPPEVMAAGLPAPEPRVLLVDAPAECDAGQGMFGGTSDALLALLAVDGMKDDVAEAIVALGEIGDRLSAASPMAAAIDRSTIHLPDPPPRAPGPRPWQAPGVQVPPPRGCRRG